SVPSSLSISLIFPFILLFVFLSVIIPPPPRSTLFPYTTLFRSGHTWLHQYRHPQLLIQRVVYLIHDIPQIHHTVHLSPGRRPLLDRKSTRLNSSHVSISYAVFCLKKKNK